MYVTFFRGTPELLVLLLFYFGSAVTLTAIAKLIDPSARFVDIPPFWAGSLALALIAGAYATESFRGAFLGVERGQIDAAQSLGLNAWQVFLLVRFPQAWRIALPAFGNHMISLVKDTALISVIGLNEIMFTAKMATSVTDKPFTMFAVVAVIYLAFTTVLTKGFRRLEACGRAGTWCDELRPVSRVGEPAQAHRGARADGAAPAVLALHRDAPRRADDVGADSRGTAAAGAWRAPTCGCSGARRPWFSSSSSTTASPSSRGFARRRRGCCSGIRSGAA